MPTIKLTDAEVEGRRRLLKFIVRLRTEDKLGDTSLRFASSSTYRMSWNRGRCGEGSREVPRRDDTHRGRRESRRGHERGWASTVRSSESD